MNEQEWADLGQRMVEAAMHLYRAADDTETVALSDRVTNEAMRWVPRDASIPVYRATSPSDLNSRGAMWAFVATTLREVVDCLGRETDARGADADWDARARAWRRQRTVEEFRLAVRARHRELCDLGHYGDPGYLSHNARVMLERGMGAFVTAALAIREATMALLRAQGPRAAATREHLHDAFEACLEAHGLAARELRVDDANPVGAMMEGRMRTPDDLAEVVAPCDSVAMLDALRALTSWSVEAERHASEFPRVKAAASVATAALSRAFATETGVGCNPSQSEPHASAG